MIMKNLHICSLLLIIRVYARTYIVQFTYIVYCYYSNIHSYRIFEMVYVKINVQCWSVRVSDKSVFHRYGSYDEVCIFEWRYCSLIQYCAFVGFLLLYECAEFLFRRCAMELRRVCIFLGSGPSWKNSAYLAIHRFSHTLSYICQGVIRPYLEGFQSATIIIKNYNCNDLPTQNHELNDGNHQVLRNLSKL